MSSKRMVEGILKNGDVRINGGRPWDIRVHDERFYERVVRHGSLGFGESYMDGWWDCDQIDECISRLLQSNVFKRIPKNIPDLARVALLKIKNFQTRTRSKQVAKQHYDIGNDFYTTMLDPYMQYSCGYFKDTDDLATAQRQKLDLICRKLQLKKGDRLLDIGCGWGGLAKFAAENYGCHVTGITISEEQAKLAKEFCAGLPVDIRVIDYRDMHEQFDKIVSVGMFEHVGDKNYATYMQAAHRCLKDDGLFLLHSIGINHHGTGVENWIQKYIFPNSMIPSIAKVANAVEDLFIMEDWHNFGAYYDKTLMAWHANFTNHWPEFRDRYGDRFERMWRYYLLMCAGGFRARYSQLWQIVYSKKGVPGGYVSVR